MGYYLYPILNHKRLLVTLQAPSHHAEFLDTIVYPCPMKNRYIRLTFISNYLISNTVRV